MPRFMWLAFCRMKNYFLALRREVVGEFVPEDFELEMPVGAGTLPIRVGWTVNTVNLAQAGASADSRDLGLRVMWVGLNSSP
jgi:hypothetical protein